MTDPTLTQLNTITAYGRVLYNGQHFSVKFRKDFSDNLMLELQRVKSRNPELLVYKTKKNKVIFGGTFSQHQSILANELRLLR